MTALLGILVSIPDRGATQRKRMGTLGSRRRRAATLITAFLASLCAVGCARNVVRISNGSTKAERSILPQAYAAYARARLLERASDPRAAAGYEEVLRLDSSADEAWIRLGALHCESDLVAANRAFDRAARLNAQSAALFHARARCSLAQRDFTAAQSSADAALRLDPTNPTHSSLVIQIHLARGHRQEAERLAWSHVAVFPNDTAARLALADIVVDKPGLRGQLQRRATDRVVRQYAYWSVVDTSAAQRSPTRLDLSAGARIDLEHALTTSDRRVAQRAARELGLGIVELMALAYELGALDFAREQAALAGQIKPDDVGIWLKRLQLADRLRDDEEFDRLLKLAPARLTEPTPVEAEPLLELVARRTGLELAPKSTH